MFIFHDQVKIYDTDAAGILFFGSIYRLMQDAFESFFESKGYSLNEVFKSKDLLIPVVHSEADYKIPMRVGDNLQVHVRVEG